MNQIARNQWVDGVAADAGVREQLIAAAGEHFAKFGFERTTLADLAKSIGFSKTYFYRFFNSKQEIGEAVCSQILGTIIEAVEGEISSTSVPTEQLRKMLRTIPAMGSELFFQERRLHDVAATSSEEHWSSSARYWDRLGEILSDILRHGREAGEFERKTPIDELTRAVLLAMRPFIDPRVLQYHLDFVPDGSNEVVSLILRSLAP